MKKVFMKIKEWFIWLFSREVGEAMNDGKPYKEVEQIVKRKARGRK